MTYKSEMSTLSYDRLLHWLERSDADPNQKTVGLEWEKEAVNSQGNRLPFSGECSVSTLLNRVADAGGWTRSFEGESLIGLERDRATLTLEPGGQIELSTSPCTRIADLEVQARGHLRELQEQSADWDCSFLTSAYAPVQSLDTIGWLPKDRYRHMAPFLAKTGDLAHGMMKGTTSVQVTLDYRGAAEGARKVAIGLGLSPLIAGLSASSPLAGGSLAGCKSYRARCWRATDPARTGLLAQVLDSRVDLHWYLDWLLDVPMIFRQVGGSLVRGSGTFREWMDHGINGHHPSFNDFLLHTSQVFPEIRLKGFLEFRCMDNGPLPQVLALAALWKGIFYDSKALDGAEELVRKIGFGKREHLWRIATEEGLGAQWRDRPIADWITDLLELAETGLQNQAPDGSGEVLYLASIYKAAVSGRTHADTIAELWREKVDISGFVSSIAYPAIDDIPVVAPEAISA